MFIKVILYPIVLSINPQNVTFLYRPVAKKAGVDARLYTTFEEFDRQTRTLYIDLSRQPRKYCTIGKMEREGQIVEAKRVLHRLLSLSGKPHTRHIRMHSQAMEDNLNRVRALEGICGRCKNLKLRFGRVDGKEVVAVLCRKQYMPVKIYENIPMGQEVACYGFDKVS